MKLIVRFVFVFGSDLKKGGGEGAGRDDLNIGDIGGAEPSEREKGAGESRGSLAENVSSAKSFSSLASLYPHRGA